MLEVFMITLICFFALSMAWFIPKAGTKEMDKPIGKQFAVIAVISIPIAIAFSKLIGVI